jgi:uncharacterized coiled-coil DUF342 family protein
MIEKQQIQRLQKYRELLEYIPYLRMFQRTYNMLPEAIEIEIRRIEIKLLTDVSLNRDEKVFLNTLERLYKQQSNFVG